MTDSVLSVVARSCRALRNDCNGVAIIEFAIALPVLLILVLVGLETANYAIAIQRVSQIAAVVADTASRGAVAIDDKQINEIMTGAKMIGAPIDFAQNGRIILSDLEQSTSNTARQWIRWQRCSGAKQVVSSYGLPTTMASSTMASMGPPANQIAAQAGAAVMFVEVVYDYQPLVGRSVIGTPTVRSTSAFNVRQRDNYELTTGGLSDAEKSLCSQYAA